MGKGAVKHNSLAQGSVPVVHGPATGLESVLTNRLMATKRISVSYFRQGDTENDRKLRNKVGLSGDVMP